MKKGAPTSRRGEGRHTLWRRSTATGSSCPVLRRRWTARSTRSLTRRLAPEPPMLFRWRGTHAGWKPRR